MNNPWKALPDVPTNGEYVLSEDKPYIDAFNARTKNENHRIRLEYTPEPRLGPVDANVYLLQANPSCPAKPREGMNLVEDACLVSDIKNEQSLHKAGDEDAEWWDKRFRVLRGIVGPDNLKRNLCSVEYFPYRSNQFAHTHIRLPSQAYSFDLVSQAVRSGKPIIVVRCYDAWIGSVPELAMRDDLVFRLNSAQSSYVTKNNLPEGAFGKIVNALKRQN